MSEQKDDAFVKNYSEIQGSLLHFIHSILPLLNDAEDVLQETAITLWKKRDEYDAEKGTFLAWSCGIARYKAIDHLRRRRPSCLLGEQIANQIADLAFATLKDKHARQRSIQALELCLKKLDVQDQSLLRLHYGQKVSVKQIAVQKGRGLSIVYDRLHKIRCSLAKCIERQLELGTDG